LLSPEATAFDRLLIGSTIESNKYSLYPFTQNDFWCDDILHRELICWLMKYTTTIVRTKMSSRKRPRQADLPGDSDDDRMRHIAKQLTNFQNTVMFVGLSKSFDSMFVPLLLTNGRFEPRLFPSVISHFNVGCTLSIFKTGNSMGTGARSQYRTKLAALLLCAKLNSILPLKCVRVTSHQVVNLVASVKLGFDIDIERLQRDFQFSGLYEKRSFQGLNITMVDCRCTFVVFPKGCKINCAGIRDADDLDAIAKRMLIFYDYRVNSTAEATEDDEEPSEIRYAAS
jgi:TATA-box binding protein (TBP) (component of TFIID and TFIIIB)